MSGGDSPAIVSESTTPKDLEALEKENAQSASTTWKIVAAVVLALAILLVIVLMIATQDNSKDDTIRVLFVGNSFTYGPADHYDKERLHNLPTMFKELGESLGLSIEVGEDTIGGCTIDIHTPERNPLECDASADPATCHMVDGPRVIADGLEECSVPAYLPKTGFNHSYGRETYHPCPQLLRYEDWDYIVLQEHSAVPTVLEAAKAYTYPAFESYKKYMMENIPGSKLVAYMTWSYYNGSLAMCPNAAKTGCFRHGIVKDFRPTCNVTDDVYRNSVSALGMDIPANIACMTYNVALGYMQTLNYGADMVAPVGLVWDIARGGAELPEECKAVTDDIYKDEHPLWTYPIDDLPKFDDVSAVAGDDYGSVMFRDTGLLTKGAKYCTNNCTIDHHASAIGMYTSANVILATTLGKSTKGASYRPEGVPKEQADLIQAISTDLVLNHRETWYPAVTKDS